MTVSQERLAIILLYSFVVGFFLGIVYDFFRIRRLSFRVDGRLFEKNKERSFRKEKNFEHVIIFFEDVLFALISSVVVCIFIFYMNSGRFRGITLVGAFLGFLLYYKTVGRLVMLFSGIIIGFIKFLIRKIYDYTLRPVIKGVIFIIRHTVLSLLSLFLTWYLMKQTVKKASAGFNILDIIKKGRNKNEKSFKHIRKNRRIGVHSVLLGDDNKNAIRVQRTQTE